MANSKRKCAYCKERQPAETMLVNGSQAFCSKDHFIEYAVSNRKALSAKGKQVSTRKKEPRYVSARRLCAIEAGI